MKIVVCIKQVPDTKGGVKFNPDGTLDRAAMLTIMNPDDKAGLEAALRLKDQYGAEVTVLTMGLPKAEDVLREAIAMGADNGILVTDRVKAGIEPFDNVKAEIKDFLTNQEKVKTLQQFVDTLKNNAKIEYNDPSFNPAEIQKALKEQSKNNPALMEGPKSAKE